MQRGISICFALVLSSSVICSSQYRNVPASQADAPRTLLAVLEHSDSSAYLRCMFSSDHRGWKSLCKIYPVIGKLGAPFATLPESWSVYYKSQSIGQVHVLGVSQIDRSVYVLKQAGDVPTVGPIDSTFSGWPGTPRFRPLIAISTGIPLPACPWNEVTMSNRDRREVINSYRKLVGDTVRICSLDQPVSDSLISYAYSDADIRFGPSYQITKNLKIVSVKLNPSLDHCDNSYSEVWSVYWFGLDSLGMSFQISAIHGTDSNYESMELVDIGDFDGNGSLEALFWLERYNEDGYVLFFNDFKRSLVCSWHYH